MERDSSSRAPNTQQTRPKPPGYFPFKSAFNYPSLYADLKVRKRSMHLLREKPGDWLRGQLHEIMVTGSYVTQACLGLQSQNDTLPVKEEFNELLGKYKTLKLQTQPFKRKCKELDNLCDNIIPRMERESGLKDKEISNKDKEILKLRKKHEVQAVAQADSRIEIDRLKNHLNVEIGSVVVYNAMIQKFESQLSQSELNLSASEEQLKKDKEDLQTSSEKMKDLEFELGDQADQLQELDFFGPSVFPACRPILLTI